MQARTGAVPAAALVEGIRRGEPAATARLYAELYEWSAGLASQGVSAADVEDLISNTFVAVLDSVRSDRLRDPNALFGFARTILSRAVAGYTQELARRRPIVQPEVASCLSDTAAGPAEILLARERSDAFARAFVSLTERDREILLRFYLRGQSEAQISQEMHLTATQYRLLKSRAKGRLTRAVARLLNATPAAERRTSSKSEEQTPRPVSGMMADESPISFRP